MKRQLCRLVTGLVMLGGSVAASAGSYGFLSVNGTDASLSFEISSIKRITFDSDNMIVTMSDESVQTIPLKGMERMFFSETSGLTTLATENSTFRLDGRLLHVKAVGGATVTLYNMKGMVVKEVNTGQDEVDISLTDLVRGVYIVKVGNEARKIMNK